MFSSFIIIIIHIQAHIFHINIKHNSSSSIPKKGSCGPQLSFLLLETQNYGRPYLFSPAICMHLCIGIFILVFITNGSWYNVVGVVTRLMDLENTVIVVWLLVEARHFSLLLSVQTSMRSHAAS
jgi:hypothetical protein